MGGTLGPHWPTVQLLHPSVLVALPYFSVALTCHPHITEEEGPPMGHAGGAQEPSGNLEVRRLFHSCVLETNVIFVTMRPRAFPQTTRVT